MTSRTNGNGKPPALRRCAVYTRQSVARADGPDFTSCDAQTESCQQYVQSRAGEGWRLLPEVYRDGGFSGGTMERPAFQRLLADVVAGKVDVVVVYKIDRLSRSLLDFAQVMDDLSHAGCDLVSVTQNFSTADSMGRLTLNMLMSFAQFEREMIAERTRDKIAASRRRGKWTGGPVPMGYRVENRRLVVVDDEAQLIREIFDLFLIHRSAADVAQELNARGRRTKVHARPGGQCGGQPWNRPLVLRVLRNQIYAGLQRNGQELHPGEHAAIIELDVWQRVQSTLDSQAPGGTPTQGRNAQYLLRGLLRCGCCGGAYTSASTAGKGGVVYRYYRCETRLKAGNQGCPARQLPAEEIEQYVAERLREEASDPSLAGDVHGRMLERVAEERTALESERKAAAKRVAALRMDAERMAGALANAGDSHVQEALAARIQDIGRRRQAEEIRLAEMEARLAALAGVAVDAEWVAAALRDFDTLWAAMTPENRGRLLRALVRQVVVNEPAGTVRIEMVDLAAGMAAAA